ncbi:polysaccharide deacetylase family protein [Flavobacterium orientale]|uniref:NodB homology domain-containing protein n=1 Tax=Flavobacterium orientale TaxID=1756020 RepID=A0A916Y4F1_9FLAO|nr:polysaccharide deacetylase family protein [Flavobacterium orientale]GGD30204.1 hypothetical protein GCM10011343_20500 [Flavobacterium orientale]
MKEGKFVISLDFELVWGIFDHISLPNKKAYFQNTLYVIPRILELFEKNNCKVTWATVGMLLNENWEQWRAMIPEDKPSYNNKNLDAYTFGLTHEKSGYDHFFFAPQLVKRILATPGQELATHTYSHYYCQEEGQTLEQFETDLDVALKMTKKLEVAIQSIVFPRNQFNQNYVNACVSRGIVNLRSNPDSWFWQDKKAVTMQAKVMRTLDTVIPFTKTSYSWNKIIRTSHTEQPSSRFLKPLNAISFINDVRLKRIFNEMVWAAKNGEVYHLWWHPHNFGTSPNESLKQLELILEHFRYLRENFNMQSCTMGDLSFVK